MEWYEIIVNLIFMYKALITAPSVLDINSQSVGIFCIY